MGKPERHKPSREGLYFGSDPPTEFFSSGCYLLDCVLGGGWAKDKIINIIGDKSTGKTLLAIEAFINAIADDPDVWCRYHEAEAAFDKYYAASMGLPVDQIDFVGEEDGKLIDTVEDWFAELSSTIDSCNKSGRRCLYILDSLDALTDKEEKKFVKKRMKRQSEKGSYGLAKAKEMSRMFRSLIRDLKGSHVTVVVISQIRDKIGVVFGKDWDRSGGRALDFYASQVLVLAELRKIMEEFGEGKKILRRAVGADIRAHMEKSKVCKPHRECDFSIIYDYGIDDISASLAWFTDLIDVGFVSSEEVFTGIPNFEVFTDTSKKEGSLKYSPVRLSKMENALKEEDDPEVREWLEGRTKEVWKKVEKYFSRKSSKYLMRRITR